MEHKIAFSGSPQVASRLHRRSLDDRQIAPLPERWRAIVEDVCEQFRVCRKDVLSGWRGRRVTKARHAIWYEIRKRFGSSLPAIGRRFGYDHSSVLHGIRMHQQRIAGVCEQQY